MEIRNDFVVALPPDETWAVLLDIPRIAPCVPGAELTDVADDKKTYGGKVTIRVGPVTLDIKGTAFFEEINEEAHIARVKAKGADVKGRGGANASIVFSLAPAEQGTKVNVLTEVDLSGSVAQYGRASGLIQNVASELVRQFADNLSKMIDSAEPDSGATTTRTAKPISGFTLLLSALKARIRQLFGSQP